MDSSTRHWIRRLKACPYVGDLLVWMQSKPFKSNDFTNLKPLIASIVAEPITISDATILPEFTADGLLPAGVHLASWSCFVERFAHGDKRPELLSGLVRQLKILRDCGCREVILGGSLVSSKPRPRDFDGCYDVRSVDNLKLRGLDKHLLVETRSDFMTLLKQDGGGLFPNLCMPSCGGTMADFLQCTRKHQRRGVVLIPLDEAFDNDISILSKAA